MFVGEKAERVKVPDYARLLPEPIQRFTTQGVYDMSEHTHMSFIQGSGHGGSHPHLAHEFVMSIVEDREPFPNACQSANWTSVGIWRTSRPSRAAPSSSCRSTSKKQDQFTLPRR